ncbi:hypothetical protein ACH4FX_40580 [Streptomyces sp. NPDC018019]|uniref:hypothetical protein n=1 Tax=Streptomyces sp. NPDC018019 TaxID=3365030 RepID=UPI0037898040
MTEGPAATFELQVKAQRISVPGKAEYELLASGEGQIAGESAIIELTHQAEILPDGSEIGTAQGYLRSTSSTEDHALFRGLGSFRHGSPGAQIWYGTFIVQSQSPKFAALNAHAFGARVELVPEGPIKHRWWSLEGSAEGRGEA